MKRNVFRDTLDKFCISNTLAAELLKLRPITIAHMKSPSYTARVTSKRLGELAYNVLDAYVDYLEDQLDRVIIVLNKIEGKKDAK